MACLREKNEIENRRLVNPVFLLYFSGFLDLFGVSIIIPLLLPHARDLGASPSVAGAVDSVYGAVQLFSSPVLGQWSDRTGRHFSLSVCLLLAGLGYLTMGLVSSIPLLLLSRIPLGIFKHSQNFSRTYLADLVVEDRRSSVLGYFNAASSMGFILGPIVGGHVAELPGGFSYAAFLGGGVFCLNAALVWFLLPTTKKLHTGSNKTEATAAPQISDSSPSQTTQASKLKSFSPKDMLQSLTSVDWSGLWDLFLFKFLASFSMLLFRSNFSMVLKQKYNASPKTRGYMMSYGGVIGALCGFGVGRFTKLYSSMSQVCLHMLLLQTFTLFALTVSPSTYFIFTFLTPLSFVTAVQRAVVTDLTMRRGCIENRGSLMGLSHSIMSVARMMAPFLAGLAQQVHLDGASVVAMVMSVSAAVLIFIRPQDHKDSRKKEKPE